MYQPNQGRVKEQDKKLLLMLPVAGWQQARIVHLCYMYAIPPDPQNKMGYSQTHDRYISFIGGQPQMPDALPLPWLYTIISRCQSLKLVCYFVSKRQVASCFKVSQCKNMHAVCVCEIETMRECVHVKHAFVCACVTLKPIKK